MGPRCSASKGLIPLIEPYPMPTSDKEVHQQMGSSGLAQVFPPRQSEPGSVEYGTSKAGHSRDWEAGER